MKLSMNVYSKALKRDVEVLVLLPTDYLDKKTYEYADTRPYRTLVLLHGMTGNRQDWIDKSLLMHYVYQTNIAVIMPSGENSLYIDNELSQEAYSTWICDELLDLMRKTFHLSSHPEDTYIAGLSMGGFGALINGLKVRNVYSVIGSFSAPIVTTEALEKKFKGTNILGLSFAEQYTKNPDSFDIYKMLERDTKNYPKLFLSCGSKDFLIQENRHFVKYLKDHGIHHEYFELEDGHTWPFWDESIKRFIQYLKKL